jgi:prepilin-type N-terminal cleavage/methylation domain-containing protein
MSRLLERLRGEEHGYSLVELLVVMAILGTVLGGLTTVFVSGSNAQLQLTRRYQAQQQARLALDKLRVDIHCASAAQAQTINTYPGVKLNVTNCYTTATTVSWCAVQSTTPSRYTLYRTTATTNTCTSSDTSRLFVADYLTSNNVFTTSAIPQYALQTVGVDIKVSANPTSATKDPYELTDSIVARNATRCATSGGCSVPTVP